MPVAGRRSYSKSVYEIGTHGRYWSSSPGYSTPYHAEHFYIDSSSVTYNVGTESISNGLSVRCFKNTLNSQTLTLHAN